MKKYIKSVILLMIAVLISHYFAPYLGSIYNSLFPYELNSGWIGSSKSLEYLRGITLSLIFFLIIFSYPWVFRSKASSAWLVSPILLWEAVVDLKHIYISAIIVFIAFGLATIAKKLFKRDL